MVDEIILASIPQDKSLLYYDNGPTLTQLGIGRTFFRNSTVKFTQPYGDLELGPVFDFGVTPSVHRRLIDATCCRVYRYPHDPSRPIASTAKELGTIADEEMTKAGVINPSKFLRQWMYCEAFCAFVTPNVRYDFDIVEKTLYKGDDLERERWRRQAVEIVYGTRKPLATCDGFSRITEKFAHLYGIQCWHIDGTTRRGSDGKAEPGNNHGWVVFELDGGIRVPADTTVVWTGPADYTKSNSKIGWRTMPVTRRDWEVFMGEYYNSDIIRDEHKIKPDKLSLIAMTNDEWRAFNSVRYDAAKNRLDRLACNKIGQQWKGTP